jgi:hypothetical protein
MKESLRANSNMDPDGLTRDLEARKNILEANIWRGEGL